jgi:hypothetical protein
MAPVCCRFDGQVEDAAMMLVKLGIAAVVAALLALVVRHWLRGRRRQRLRAAPFPGEWEQIVRKHVPLTRRLPEPLRRQLYGLVQVFVAEKRFEGCGGLEITDEIRVTIAAQACLLLLNRKPTYFRKLRTILVYPSTYVARTASSDGHIGVEGEDARLGESWQSGPVVLAWDSVTGGTAIVTDARNVVLHEFAHQLDQEDGAADGAPILSERSRYATWARVLGAEYENLQRKKKGRRRSVLNKYGATDPAEFFAVATETFFEKPRQMRKRHPELYEQLKAYYRLDPAAWH